MMFVTKLLFLFRGFTFLPIEIQKASLEFLAKADIEGYFTVIYVKTEVQIFPDFVSNRKAMIRIQFCSKVIGKKKAC